MVYGYARLGPFMGEIVEERPGGLTVLEFRPDIDVWRYTKPGGTNMQRFDQPEPDLIAAYFEEFWTSCEPLPPDNGLYDGRRVAVLDVALDSDKLQVTVRSLATSATQ